MGWGLPGVRRPTTKAQDAASRKEQQRLHDKRMGTIRKVAKAQKKKGARK